MGGGVCWRRNLRDSCTQRGLRLRCDFVQRKSTAVKYDAPSRRVSTKVAPAPQTRGLGPYNWSGGKTFMKLDHFCTEYSNCLFTRERATIQSLATRTRMCAFALSSPGSPARLNPNAFCASAASPRKSFATEATSASSEHWCRNNGCRSAGNACHSSRVSDPIPRPPLSQ